MSCSSVPSRGSLAGATIIGEASDVFVFVPIKHNRMLLSRILPQNKYLEKVLDRTDYIYASLRVKHKKPMFEDMKEIVVEKADESTENEENSEVLSADAPIDISTVGAIADMPISETLLDIPIADVTKIVENKTSGEDLSAPQPTVSSMNSNIDSSIEETEEEVFKLLSYDLCAVGRYPKSIAGFVFNKRNGWQKQKASSGYKYYKKIDGLDTKGMPAFSFFSIPASNLALFSYNEKNECKMENLLDYVDSPRSVRFGEEFELSIQQGDEAKDICIYVANPHFFLEHLLDLDIDLPIDNLKVYLKRNNERAKEFYNYKIVLQMKNITAGFATRLFISKLLKTQVRIEDNNIIVEKARVSLERLVQIINKVLNRE